MSVGDVNSAAKGSGARYNTGKPDLSLIPMWTLMGEAQVWEYGKRKYAAWNWLKGMSWSIPLACALRHLAAFQDGEDNDAESGLDHLDHAMCNLRMLKAYKTVYPEGDDRPPSRSKVTPQAVAEQQRASLGGPTQSQCQSQAVCAPSGLHPDQSWSRPLDLVSLALIC